MLNLSTKYLKCRKINLRIASFAHQSPQSNYYEILRLKPDCSPKEIRDAFILLSKEFHPDTTGRDDRQAFVNILEAYKVLSKTNSRASYDFSLLQQAQGIRRNVNTGGETNNNMPWKINHMDYSQPNPGPYYGVKGISKVSNWKIVLCCAIFMAFGIAAQTFAIRNSVTFKREQLDEHSKRNAISHAEAREHAEKYGNNEQLERMKNKLQKDPF